MRKVFIFSLILISFISISQVYFLTDDGVYKSFEKVIDGIFNNIIYINNKLYVLKEDSILEVSTNKEIYIESPIYIGEGYFLSGDRLYKLNNGKLSLVRIIPKLSYPYMYKNIIFGINMGSVVAIDNGKIIWSLSPNGKTIIKIKVVNNKLAVFSKNDTTIFDITNPNFPKFLKSFKPVDDYSYNGYHVLLKNNLIQFYDENNKLVFSKSVNGKKIITDGENVIVGNYLISKKFNITTYPFKIKAIVNINNTVMTTSPKFELLWELNLNLEISGKPVTKDGTLYLATTNGKVMKIKDGKIIWNYALPFIITGHLTVTNNSILIPCWDDNLYAFDFDGNLQWKVELDSDITLGSAFDGQMIYAVSDNGFLYEIKDGKIINTFKVGKWPITGPYVTLSGVIYLVDGMGYLWKNDNKEKFVGKIKNLAFLLENPQIPPENTFILLDEKNTKYIFQDNSIIRNGITILKFNDTIKDAVIGTNFIYVITYDNYLHIISQKNYQVIYKEKLNKPKFLILDNIGTLFVIGNSIYAISTNDTPSSSWYSIYKNNFNSSSVNF